MTERDTTIQDQGIRKAKGFWSTLAFRGRAAAALLGIGAIDLRRHNGIGATPEATR
ncbi:MAG: hypothetical protein WCV92_04575 [Candidatus Buchananbacteria bacterium]